MAGARQPGSWGLEPTPVVIDDGTSPRIRAPLPGPVGAGDSSRVPLERPAPEDSVFGGAAADTLESFNQAVARFRRGETWSRLQSVVSQVVGQYSFGLGVVYGIGENVVGSVVELGQLAKTFLLADLYDRAQQSVLAAALSPTAGVQRLIAEAAMRAFGSELGEARRERDELIAELRYAMTNPGEVVENVKATYVSKWKRFEALSQERTLSSQFEAGRLFGEVLLEIVSLIGGGAAAVRAAAKVPRLARLARLKIPAESGARATGGAGAARETPAVTPTQVRGRETPVESPPPKPPPKSLAATLAGSEFNSVKAQRIRSGADTKVAVIGRNMEAVEKYADGLKDAEYRPEVFAGNRISREARDQWAELKLSHEPNWIPDSEVRKSLMFRENQAWAQKLRDEGYTVIDVGNPSGKGLSPFYEMEKGTLFPTE